MTDVQLQVLSAKEKDQLRLMYLADYDVPTIVDKLNITEETVRFFIFGPSGNGEDANCLYRQKQKLSSASIAVYVKDKLTVFEKSAGLALDILNVSMNRLRQNIIDDPENNKLSVAEMKAIADIATGMDKLVRLESGQVTENIKMIGLTLAESQEILRNDPFAAAVDCEFKELDTRPPWLSEGEKPDGDATRRVTETGVNE
jgi:hypothetical protein